MTRSGLRVGLRIGLLVPASNTTMEAELRAWLPEAEFRTLGIRRPGGLMTLAGVPEEMDRAEQMAGAFAGDSVDAVIYGCTAAGFLAGSEGDARLAERLRKATGKPVVTTASSMVAALQSSGSRRIGVVTPYAEEVNGELKKFLRASAIEVGALEGFGVASLQELVKIEAPQVRALAAGALPPGGDGLFIACSQLPTRDILPPLERELGVPVWSSIKSTAWNAARTFNLKEVAA